MLCSIAVMERTGLHSTMITKSPMVCSLLRNVPDVEESHCGDLFLFHPRKPTFWPSHGQMGVGAKCERTLLNVNPLYILTSNDGQHRSIIKRSSFSTSESQSVNGRGIVYRQKVRTSGKGTSCWKLVISAS